MTTWLDTGLLRAAANNSRAADEAGLQLAADIACAKVEELCGPVLLTTVTDELVRGGSGCSALATRYYIRALTAVKSYPDGTTLTLTDYAAAPAMTGQTLWRKDGGTLSSDLLVTYTTGGTSATVADSWAIAAAQLIGQQYLKLMRVFGPNPNAAAEGGTRDLVPTGAMHLMADHLLAPGGFA